MALEPTHKRVILAVVLSTLTTTSFLTAQGTTQIAASAFLDRPPSADDARGASRGRSRTAAAPTRDLTAMARAILQRNIFDSTTGAISWDPPPPPVEVVDDGETAVVEEIDPNAPPPPCEGNVRLVASYYRSNAPEQSFAAITNNAGTALLYTAGMRVDDREVVAIGRSRVILRPAGGALCSASMFAEVPVATSPRSVTPPAVTVAPAEPAGASGGIPSDELDSNIQQISETSYAINRSLVDRLLANQAELMRTARVIPHEVDGRVVGVKIYGIRRSSLLGRLGIQNGDMLRTINGFDLTEPDSVLEAYTRLRSAERLSLSVERRGQAVTMDYQVR